MFVMRLPVDSRSAATMSSLSRQKPVSSVAEMTPANALLNSEIFRMTRFPTSLVLNEAGPGKDMFY